MLFLSGSNARWRPSKRGRTWPRSAPRSCQRRLVEDRLVSVFSASCWHIWTGMRTDLPGPSPPRRSTFPAFRLRLSEGVVRGPGGAAARRRERRADCVRGRAGAGGGLCAGRPELQERQDAQFVSPDRRRFGKKRRRGSRGSACLRDLAGNEASARSPILHCNLAIVYAWTGQPDKAIAPLEPWVEQPVGRDLSITRPTEISC